MKKIILICLLFSGFACANNNVLTDSLKDWHPLRIIQNDDELTIVLNERQITNVIYDGVIQNGVCLPSWLGNKSDKYLDNLKSISVVNMFKHQGYTLINPKMTCKAVGKATSKVATTLVMANSKFLR